MKKRLLAFLLAAAMAVGNTAIAFAADEKMQSAAVETMEEYQFVTAQDVLTIAQNGTGHVIDVRQWENYVNGRIQNSKWCPIFPLDDESLAEKMKEYAASNLKDGKPIYIVCNSGQRGAQKATAALIESGIDASLIYTVEGGAKALGEIEGALTTNRYDEKIDWKYVSPEKALEKIGSDEVQLLDVRDADTYAAGHLKGSLNCGLKEVENADAQTAMFEFGKEKLDKSKPVYLLCYSGNKCAKTAISVLKDAGFDTDQLFIIEGGAGVDAIKAAFVVENDMPFKDVSDKDWFYENVADVYKNKIMTGIDPTTFGPNVAFSRAQFVTALYRIEGKPDAEYAPVFPDVPKGEFYSNAVMWAIDAGVTTGYAEGYFGTSDAITREQLVTMLYRYSAIKNMNIYETMELAFTDNAKVSGWALDPMKWAAAIGVIKGNEGTNTVDPQGTSNRAISAAVLSRFLAFIKQPGYEKATAEEVKEALESDTAVVADARTNDAYAGWASGDNKMGGHIEGATDFSANWLTCTFDDENNLDGMTREEHLQKYMKDKKISPDTPVIVYDENGEDAVRTANYLSARGVKDVKVFDLAEWKEELASYANYELYIPASAVKDLIDQKEVPEVGKVKDLKIVEVSWGTEEQSGFTEGHVPGAVHVNSDDFDQADNYYLLRTDEELLNLAKSLGITTKSTVVVVGNPIFACRYAVILKYLGVEDVFVMSGGYDSWTDAGYELETGSSQPVPAADFGADVPQDPDLIDTVDETKELLKDEDFVLVDNRTEEEFKGETSGYEYFPHKGRIEGAVYGYAGVGNSSSMLYYDNLDTTMRNADEILSMWKTAGIDTSRHLSFMCGGGYRAAEVLWNSKVMGLNNTSLFADGWCGWSAAGLPYISGE